MLGGHDMDYKKIIIDMVENIENLDYLKKIYDFVLVPHRLEQLRKNEEKGD